MSENEYTSRQDQQAAVTKPWYQRLSFVQWLLILVVALVLFGVGHHIYVQHDEKNYAALDVKNKKTKEVRIKDGSSTQMMAQTLKKDGVLRSKRAFNHYVTSHNYSDLKAGYYELSPNMTVQQIVTALRMGGSAVPTNSKNVVVVREGETVDNIAKEVGEKTTFSAASFRKAANDPKLFKTLQEQYPGLFDSAAKAKNVRYHLEGYLYPATYTWRDAKTVDELVEMMVQQEYIALQPRFQSIKKSGMTIQQVLTLASLVEREGIDNDSRRTIAGVFLNRIDAKMPLQSDIATKYALKTNRTNLTNKDVQSDNPYNLYKFSGYGPGPFNNPSVESIDAVLHPKDRDKGYRYFVANLKTGKVYYSQSYDDHLGKSGDLEATNESVGNAADSANNAH
ncbi:Aminodeoxychorismate lyase [Weissella viridescens]|uniref:Endolytic murein transglycosylase n=2 Tax=Weissella viridescens TaxID=1629 RepID=A0A0R2H129_WEIVI|nr:endolytic transglycosylase MltG [Weissella viridescens]KRN46543.1 hypothetical protein IV50_GL000821 [Weissella viridescens]GEA94387.1 aminodeoxychorismate lyase [Weissella viridescens]SOB42520.1 Aminodeoxychorismate lyase [Weissella viridescens]